MIKMNQLTLTEITQLLNGQLYYSLSQVKLVKMHHLVVLLNNIKFAYIVCKSSVQQQRLRVQTNWQILNFMWKCLTHEFVIWFTKWMMHIKWHKIFKSRYQIKVIKMNLSPIIKMGYKKVRSNKNSNRKCIFLIK